MVHLLLLVAMTLVAAAKVGADVFSDDFL